ncbi:hypothetical protein ATY39_00730 [Rummeliibacillus stabekisii]|uniref:Oxetanocin A resistance protein n=2 Tax=Rummeliibacillus stabekisii TaxID=241244 RepID=A0A143H8J7_9BACL|nr:hypothetical protein ATY39_00730 [Rummeliibacillus stabekisii]
MTMSKTTIIDKEDAHQIREGMKADCTKCFGLCCTALNIIASSDFSINKSAGTPCLNLQSNYSCQIHSQLRDKGFKGCTVFDCLGAGQAVSQITFKGKSWRENPETGKKIFQVFPIMEQLHEMMAYVSEALTYEVPENLADKLSIQLKKLQNFTELGADDLLAFDLIKYRFSLNELLTRASNFIREKAISKLPGNRNLKDFDHARVDWIGKKLEGKDLRASDFRGAYLIASDMRNTDLREVNFIGADLRDVNLSGADLFTSMFLTVRSNNPKFIHNFPCLDAFVAST